MLVKSGLHCNIFLRREKENLIVIHPQRNQVHLQPSKTSQHPRQHIQSSPFHRIILVSSLSVVCFLLFSHLILIYLQHHICPQSPPPAPNEDSVHYSVQASSVTLPSQLPPPTTQPPPPPLPAKNKDMHIYQNTNSTTFYAVSVF